MPILPLDPSLEYDFDYAASLALSGKLAAPPSVSPAHCEAYLLEFSYPVVDDYDSSRKYTHGLLLVTRGRMGGYVQAMTVIAADADGQPITDEHESGAPMWRTLETQAQIDEVPVADFLRRAKLPI